MEFFFNFVLLRVVPTKFQFRIGNINNPSINRWGLNVFWNHFWHSKKTFSKKLQQDTAILQLLTIFLKYGLKTATNYFGGYNSLINQPLPNHQHLYTRKVAFTNVEMGTEQMYNLRTKFSAFFSTTTTILRYNQWLIVLLQFYSPSLTPQNTMFRLKQQTTPKFSNFNQTKSSLNASRVRFLQQTCAKTQILRTAYYLF